eukprot:784340-Rhodomonas_salina.1
MDSVQASDARIRSGFPTLRSLRQARPSHCPTHFCVVSSTDIGHAASRLSGFDARPIFLQYGLPLVSPASDARSMRFPALTWRVLAVRPQNRVGPCRSAFISADSCAVAMRQLLTLPGAQMWTRTGCFPSQVTSYATCLHARYAMSGTDVGMMLSRAMRCPVLIFRAMRLRVCCRNAYHLATADGISSPTSPPSRARRLDQFGRR